MAVSVDCLDRQIYDQSSSISSLTTQVLRCSRRAASMPGTLTIDTAATFQAILLMASGPKLKFGSTDQDISARGERKWDVQAAVTFHAEPGLKPVSEVIAVTVTGPAADPCASIAPGTPIVFDKMRVGFSVPKPVRTAAEFAAAARGIRLPTFVRPTHLGRPRATRPPNSSSCP